MKKIGLMILAALCCTNVFAEETEHDGSGIAISGKVSTLGLGADLTLRLSDHINLRAEANWLQWDTDFTVDDIDFDYDIDQTSFGGYIDYHPFANHFRITGGILSGDQSSTLDAVLSESVTIGDNTYSASDIGTLTGTVEGDSDTIPYIGIGFGNAVASGQRLTFLFDIGVAFQSYSVDLASSGPINVYPQFQEDLAKQEADVQDELDDWKIYPVVSFGLAFQF